MFRSTLNQHDMYEYHHINQMAIAGDVLEDFTIIFRDMMSMVCTNCIQFVFE